LGARGSPTREDVRRNHPVHGGELGASGERAGRLRCLRNRRGGPHRWLSCWRSAAKCSWSSPSPRHGHSSGEAWNRSPGRTFFRHTINLGESDVR
jgi:hypothetical protein